MHPKKGVNEGKLGNPPQRGETGGKWEEKPVHAEEISLNS